MTSITSFNESLHTAMNSDSDAESVARIKDVAMNFIQEVDSTTSIKKTDYFNHTFIPDFIMTWDNGVSKTEKQVFLRSYLDDTFLADDVGIVGSQNTFLFNLGNMPEEKQTLDSLIREKNSMVVDPSGISSLIENKQKSKFSGLLNSTTLRSGVGAISASEVENAADALETGFAAAMNLMEQDVGEAQRRIHNFLNRDAAAEIGSFLLAVWLSSSGSLHDFPSTFELSGTNISEASLRNLLELDAITDLGFWRGIARSTGIQQLQKLGSNFSSENFQHLMKASLDNFECNSIGVEVGTLEQDPYSIVKWKIEKSTLKLECGNIGVYFSDQISDLAKLANSLGTNTTMQELVDRVGEHQVSEIVLSGTGEVLSIKGLDEKSAVNTDTFMKLLTAGSSKTVDSIRVALTNGINIDVNYEKMTLGTGTRSKVRILQHLRECLGLLIETPESIEKYVAQNDSEIVSNETDDTLF